MSGRRGSATIERLPSARGPNSIRPWNQPTTSPAAIRSATSANSASSSSRSRVQAGSGERGRALVVRSTPARCRRAPSRTRAGARAPGARRGAPRRPRCPSRRPPAGRRRSSNGVSRPDAPVGDRVQRHAAREAEPRRARCAPRARSTRWRYASSSIAWSDAATSSCSAVSSDSGSRAGPSTSSSRPEKSVPIVGRAVVPGHVHAFLVVREVVESSSKTSPFGRTTCAHRRQEARGRRRARGPSPCPRRRSCGKPSHCVTAV